MVRGFDSSSVRCDISKSSFIRNVNVCIITSNESKILNGSYAGIQKKSTVIPAVGEFLEREVMKENAEYISNGITGINLLTAKKEKISGNDIYNENLFLDSCGLASHLNSKDCIESSLSEYIERQSYIFNYLSKGKGKKLNKESIKKLDYVPSIFKNFSFFDISLISEWSVILGFGIKNGKFYIGLGSSDSLSTAIKKCIKELNQFEQLYKKTTGEKSTVESEHLDYMDYFMMLSNEQLQNAYSYLEDYDFEILVEDVKEEKMSNLEIIRKLNNKCGMEPILFSLEPVRKTVPYKITYIVDRGWFPSMNPRLFTERNYKNVEDKMGVTLDRRCNFIPFP